MTTGNAVVSRLPLPTFPMRTSLFSLLVVCATHLATSAAPQPPVRLLDRAPALPLALDDDFEFRKQKLLLNDPLVLKPTVDPLLAFERQRLNYGAITQLDRIQRQGHYFTFFWRAKRSADLTLRLEYRQENLGAFVQAREVSYTGVKGSQKTEITVVGDDYREDGRITAWRALLIEGGRVVALTQSFLWN